jgi:hypothetical protein
MLKLSAVYLSRSHAPAPLHSIRPQDTNRCFVIPNPWFGRPNPYGTFDSKYAAPEHLHRLLTAHLNPAWSSHRVPLLDDNVCSLIGDAARCKVTRERSRRASYCLSLPDAHVGVEESCVRGGRRIGRLEAIQIAPLSAHRLQKDGKTLSVRPGAADDGAIACRHEQVRCPRGNDLCGEPINQEIGIREPEGVGQRSAVGAHGAKGWGGLDHPDDAWLPNVGHDLNRQNPVPELLRQRGTRRSQCEATRIGQPPPGAQRVVSGAKHLCT